MEKSHQHIGQKVHAFRTSDTMSTAVQLLNATNNGTQLTVQFDDYNKRTLIDKFLYNRNIEEPFYSLLIIFYSFLIVLGSTGNILVVLAVLRNKQMQTARYSQWLITIKFLTITFRKNSVVVVLSQVA